MTALLVALACVALTFGLGSVYLTDEVGTAAAGNLVLAAVLALAALVSGLRSGRRILRGPARAAWARALARAAAAALLAGGLMLLGASLETQWDLTERRAFTLTDFSKQVLSELPEDVEAVLAAPPSRSSEDRLLLERYAEQSERFHLRVLPAQALDARSERVRRGSRLVLRSGRRVREVPYLTERHVTQTLLDFVVRSSSTLCFVTGHGEIDAWGRDARDLSVLRTALEREGFEVVALLLSARERVPEGCDVVVLAAPERELLPAEREALAAHYRSGGRLLVFLEPDRPAEPGPLLEELGIRALRAHVVDPEARPIGSGTQGREPLVNTFTEHPVTQGLGRQTRVLFSGVRPLELTGRETRGFAYSSRSSHSTPLEGPREGAGGSGRGHLAVAASVHRWVEGDGGSGEARIVLFGDVDFATNRFVGLLYNEDLALNAVYYLVGRDDEIRIRPKAESLYQVLLTPERTLGAFHSFALLLPEAILLVGVTVWWRRRRS